MFPAACWRSASSAAACCASSTVPCRARMRPRGQQVEVVGAHLGGEAHDGARDLHPRRLEARLPGPLAAADLKEVEERLREAELDRVGEAAEAELGVEERIADGARGEQLAAGHAQLLEGGLDVAVVGERDAHRVVGGELALEERKDGRVVGGGHRGGRVPRDRLPRLLDDEALHVGEPGVLRRGGAAGGEAARRRRRLARMPIIVLGAGEASDEARA